MVGPIDDELKRKKIIKQYQDYADLNANLDKEDGSNPIGKLKGKKVKKMSSNESGTASDLFNKLKKPS